MQRIIFLVILGSLSTKNVFATEEGNASAASIEVISNILQSVNVSTSLIRTLLLKSNNSDEYLTTPELLVKYGYPAEIHTVTTADGYILELHRIPFSAKAVPSNNKPVVFLQHGILSSSSDWIIMGPEISLGYLLVDAGYDVWMGNARGNTYSKKHVSLKPTDAKFWDFSWHEMGVYDLPAVLDYVLANTSQTDMYYVGHSMGTTMFYILTSTMSQYNSKIRLMTSLAPIAFMDHVTSPIARFLGGNPLTQPLLSLMGIREFLPTGQERYTLVNELCSDKSVVQQICATTIFALCGYNPQEMNMTMLPVILSHTPAGASTKCFFHYAQVMNSGQFKQWDYGIVGNIFAYGNIVPPSYDVRAVTAPVRLIYGENDWFGASEDVLRLNQTLGNSAGVYRVPLASFQHLDFLWAIHLKSLVNDEVMRLMKEY